MASPKQHKNPFARRIQIVFTGLVLGSVVAVLSSPLNGLFVYAGTVALLDSLFTLLLKNSYLKGLNSKEVKKVTEISLKDFKKYTQFNAIRRLSTIGVLLGLVLMISLSFSSILTLYFSISSALFLIGKFRGIKFPAFITHNNEINPERTWEERNRDFSAANIGNNAMSQSYYSIYGSHIANIWRKDH